MRFTAWIVLVATLMLWSGNWIVARAVREDIAPGIATAGRLVIVLAILAPFAWFGLKNKVPGLRRRDWQVLAALGFTGGGLHLALQWLGDYKRDRLFRFQRMVTCSASAPDVTCPLP